MIEKILIIFKEPYISLFLIMTFGVIASKFKWKGISLGSSAIVFVALVFGHFGFSVPLEIEKIGLILFIFSVGIQAGPGFFEAFRTGEARQYLVPIFLTVFLAASLSYVSAIIMGFDNLFAAGIFSGITTSTATLAAIVETANSSTPILSYTIAYPISMITTILALRFLPKIMKLSVKKEEAKYHIEIEKKNPRIIAEHFLIDNPNINGKTIEELKINTMTGAVISRILKKGGTVGVIPTGKVQLFSGDIVKAVGDNESLAKVRLLIGKKTDSIINLSSAEESIVVLVTNKRTINKRLSKLNLDGLWGAEIKGIRRAGIDIIPSGNTRLRFGDKVYVNVKKDTAPNLIKMLGGVEATSIDFLPIGISIVLGVLVGQLKIPVGNLNLGPGVTGGILLTTLILGRLGKTGPLLWSIAGTTNQFLRQLGLMFFLCGVGTRTGVHFIEAVSNQGLKLVSASIFISLITVIVTSFIVIKVQKMNGLRVLGALAGSFTCAPALPNSEDVNNSTIPFSAYSIVYPFALLLSIVVGQLMLLL